MCQLGSWGVNFIIVLLFPPNVNESSMIIRYIQISTTLYGTVIAFTYHPKPEMDS